MKLDHRFKIVGLIRAIFTEDTINNLLNSCSLKKTQKNLDEVKRLVINNVNDKFRLFPESERAIRRKQANLYDKAF